MECNPFFLWVSLSLLVLLTAESLGRFTFFVWSVTQYLELKKYVSYGV